jgi:hypothetical protein
VPKKETVVDLKKGSMLKNRFRVQGFRFSVKEIIKIIATPEVSMA